MREIEPWRPMYGFSLIQQGGSDLITPLSRRTDTAQDRITCAFTHTGRTVVPFTRSITKLVRQSWTLGCLSKVSIMKRE
jgi:hypothetical protein